MDPVHWIRTLDYASAFLAGQNTWFLRAPIRTQENHIFACGLGVACLCRLFITCSVRKLSHMPELGFIFPRA